MSDPDVGPPPTFILEGEDTTVLPGMTIYSPGGQAWTVIEIRDDGQVVAQTTTDQGVTANTILPPNTYGTLSGAVIEVANDGKVFSTRTMSSSERSLYNLPFSLPSDGGDGTAGDGTAGGTLTDPVAFLRTMLEKIKVDIAKGEIDYANGLAQFNRWSDLVDKQQTNQQNQITNAMTEFRFQQTSDQQKLDTQELDVTRGLDIASERRRTGTTIAQDILPYSIPGATGIEIPGIAGTFPLHQLGTTGAPGQIDLNNLFGVDALNNVPAVDFQPTPVPEFQTLDTIDLGQAPIIPDIQQPDATSDAVIQQLINNAMANL